MLHVLVPPNPNPLPDCGVKTETVSPNHFYRTYPSKCVSVERQVGCSRPPGCEVGGSCEHVCSSLKMTSACSLLWVEGLGRFKRRKKRLTNTAAVTRGVQAPLLLLSYYYYYYYK